MTTQKQKDELIEEIEHTCGFDYGDDFCPECFSEGKQAIINKVKKIHKRLSDKYSSWGEYDRQFIKELEKLK